jgi:hypothetical protein
MVSSEIGRGLDVFELMPSPMISQNEIDAAKTVRLDHLNTQGQPQFEWPASFALARAYVDQLERSGGLSSGNVGTTRERLAAAESATDAAARQQLTALADELSSQAGDSSDRAKVQLLASAVRELAGS